MLDRVRAAGRVLVTGYRAAARGWSAPGEKGSVEAARMAEELAEAFQDLAIRNGTLVKQFWDAYVERATTPGLSESDEEDGLVLVLTDLFWGPPPALYFDPSSYSQRDPEARDVYVVVGAKFRKALTLVAERHPHVLEWLSQYKIEQRRTDVELLRAYLAFYARNRRAYPA